MIYKVKLYSSMHYEPKCLNMKHRSQKVCISAACNVNNPFICQTCGNHHQKTCEVIDYKQLVRKLHKLQGINRMQLLKYQQNVEQTFSTIMKSLQAEFVVFREQFQHINASNRIVQFYQLLKSHKENKLSARFIGNILEEKLTLKNKYRVKSQSVMWSLSSQLIQLQKKINTKLRYYYTLQEYDQNNELIAEVSLDLQAENAMKKVEKVFRKNREQLTGGLLENNINFIQPLFGKEIYNLQPLFRASEHNFSASAFHEICDGKAQTLTIAKTEYGNLVGGYSNVPWRNPKNWEYSEDPSNQTFIFSLHKNLVGLKFRPFKKKFTIGMHECYGPSFGDDLVIYDKSNTSKGCWSNFPDCYRCKEKEVEHNQSTIRYFVGVNDHYKKFNIVEWEVYKISFNSKEQLQRSFMEQYRKI